MRDGSYDEHALIESKTLGHVPFAKVVEALGLEAAIRDLTRCWWLSDSACLGKQPKNEPCIECLELKHS